jgi:hypothetical protein
VVEAKLALKNLGALEHIKPQVYAWALLQHCVNLVVEVVAKLVKFMRKL